MANFPNAKNELCKVTWIDKNKDQPFRGRIYAHEVKVPHLSQIVKLVHGNQVPPQLIINWDQTGHKYSPSIIIDDGRRQKSIPIVGLGNDYTCTRRDAI